MGDDITIEDIQIIEGGLIQIDFRNEKIGESWRAFCSADKFFGMIGKSMNDSHEKTLREFEKSQGR